MIDRMHPYNAFVGLQTSSFADEPAMTCLASYSLQEIEGMSRSKLFTVAVRIGTQDSYLDSDGYAHEVQCRSAEANALTAKWKTQVLNRGAAVNANALTVTVKPVFEALTLLGAGAVDLRDLSTKEVNGVHLAVVLRATYKQRERTPGWKDALAIAREALSRDGLDEKDALIGLIK
jgi:hypothetical protein